MLDAKVVAITGATGGLGRELVSQFLEAGSVVLAIARSEDSLKKLKREMNSDQLHTAVVDVADFTAVKRCIDQAAKNLGSVDILFNNAAIYPRVSFIEEKAEDFLSALAINLGGISNCSKAVLPYMIESGFGRIYNLGSFADLSPIENSSSYACAKGGVHALTKAIAKDIESLNLDIEIHEWVPGHLKTRMSEFTGIDPAVSAAWGVRIASGDIPASTQCVLFENDHEWIPPKRLKQRIKEKLLFWK